MWSFIRNLTPRKNASLIIVAAFLSVGAFATIINVLPAQMSDNDFGDFTCSGGDCTLNALVVDTAEIASTSVSGGKLQPDIINVQHMADANHGAVTWSGGTATVTDLVCTSCVNATDIATGAVQPDEIQNNAVREAGLDNTLCLQVLASSATNPTELNATPNFLDLVDGAGSETENNEDNYLMFAA